MSAKYPACFAWWEKPDDLADIIAKVDAQLKAEPLPPITGGIVWPKNGDHI